MLIPGRKRSLSQRSRKRGTRCSSMPTRTTTGTRPVRPPCECSGEAARACIPSVQGSAPGARLLRETQIWRPPTGVAGRHQRRHPSEALLCTCTLTTRPQMRVVGWTTSSSASTRSRRRDTQRPRAIDMPIVAVTMVAVQPTAARVLSPRPPTVRLRRGPALPLRPTGSQRGRRPTGQLRSSYRLASMSRECRTRIV